MTDADQALHDSMVDMAKKGGSVPDTTETTEAVGTTEIVDKIETTEAQETTEQATETVEAAETTETTEAEETAPVVPEGYISWKDNFSDYETPDQIKNEVITYKQKAEDAEKKYQEAITSMAPGETEDQYKIRMINKDNPDKYEIAKQVIMGDPTPLEFIKLNLKNNVPTLSDLTDAELDTYVKNKYVLTMDGVDMDDEEEVAKRNNEIINSKVALRIDGDTAKKTLLDGLHVDVPVQKSPDDIVKEETLRSEKFQQDWSPVFSGLQGQLDKFPVPVQGEKGVETLMEVEMPKDKIAGYIKQAAEHLHNTGTSPTPESTKFVKDFVRLKYVEEHITDIVTKAVRKTREMSDDQWMKLKFNSKPPTTSAPKTPVKQVTTESAYEEKMRKVG